MALHLPQTVEISSNDRVDQLCEFCLQAGVADPDALDAWAAHLSTVHGYRVERDDTARIGDPRTIRLSLAGWSTRAKFQPNARVDVNDKAPADYAGRRGTVVGWHSHTSEYAVRFDEEPIVGFLSSDSLAEYSPRTR